jgi:hypothetical protein
MPRARHPKDGRQAIDAPESIHCAARTQRETITAVGTTALRRGALAVAGAAVCAAACQGHDAAPRTVVSPAVDASAAAEWSPPFDVPRLPFPATQTLPSVKNLPPGDAYLEWIFVGTDHAAKVLHIAVFGHGCSSLTGVRTEETIDKVTIGVINHHDLPNRDTCNGAGPVAAISVQLTAPLGNRGLWAFQTVDAK